MIVERILARGPRPCAHWEYYPARQASPEHDKRSTIQLTGREAVDVATFMYGIEPSSWATLHLSVHHPAMEAWETNEQMQLVYLALDDLLGEDEVETWIGHVEYCDTPPESPVDAAGLRARVDELRSTHDASTCSVGRIPGEDSEQQELLFVWRMGLKRLQHVWLDTHVEVVIEIPSAKGGMCDAAEVEILNDAEDALLSQLSESETVWLGHVTGVGRRTVRFQTAHAEGLCAAIDAWAVENFRVTRWTIEFVAMWGGSAFATFRDPSDTT